MIGETLYTRDENRRLYKNNDGTERSSPNPAYYWLAHTITGETRDSWVLDDDRYKVDKKTLAIRNSGRYPALDPHAYTEAGKADWLWANERRHEIVERVRRADVATLKQIAALLGIG